MTPLLMDHFFQCKKKTDKFVMIFPTGSAAGDARLARVRRRCIRKAHRYARAAIDFARDRNRAAVQLRNGFHEGETESPVPAELREESTR